MWHSNLFNKLECDDMLRMHNEMWHSNLFNKLECDDMLRMHNVIFALALEAWDF
jgi:hypothetical protein